MDPMAIPPPTQGSKSITTPSREQRNKRIWRDIVAPILRWNKINALTSKRPMVEVQVGSKSQKMLYDTGASATVFREDQMEFLKPGLIKKFNKDECPGLFSASGTRMEWVGAYTVEVTIMGVTKRIDVQVVRNLHEKAILGVNAIKEFGLQYNPVDNSCFIGMHRAEKARLQTVKRCKIEAMSFGTVKVRCMVPLKSETNVVIATVQGIKDEHRGIRGDPQLADMNAQGGLKVRVFNAFPYAIEVSRGEVIGAVETLDGTDINEIRPEEVLKHNEEIEKATGMAPTKADEEFIRKTAKILAPAEETEEYLRLLTEFHDVFSRSKEDLGCTDSLEHRIRLKDPSPVYQKQFRLPENHKQALEKLVLSWVKMGIVRHARSRFNSPMFMVSKKDGSLRPVQDFRALNANSMDDKYSMRDINECIDEIGFNQSKVFSTLDLTSGFWQMLLHEESREYTAFTVPGLGQFEWVTSPMGLLGCPASFQRLMELVTMGLVGVIVYIDDLLVHSASHQEQRDRLRRVFQRIRGHGLKLNLSKCEFGAGEVNYLGFRLTEHGIYPGLDKTKAIREAEPPSNAQEVRQFLGLCNFFRQHIPDFARRTSALCQKTTKGASWKEGLGEQALKEFEELKQALCNQPILRYPHPEWEYWLFTDASTGTDTVKGGLGAVLSQKSPDNTPYVLGYASRRLQTHEENYSPFLLEQAAAVWGMEHFQVYLRGRPFTLVTDHKPLEALSKIHTKTLRRLQEAMMDFEFKIEYMKGEEMPADYLSRCMALDSKEDTQITNTEFTQEEQEKDEQFDKDRLLLLEGLWRSKEHGTIFVPREYRQGVIELSHNHPLSGHKGISKTKEKIGQEYWWPKWQQEVYEYVSRCEDCKQKIVEAKKNTPLAPLPLTTQPNQRIHVDLFGPVNRSEKGNKHVLIITDAYTKYAEAVAIPDKEAVTVATGIFNRWICRFGIPDSVLSDGGTEFVNKVAQALFDQLNVKKMTTTPYHPQCNAQAEVINKSLARYMRTMLEDDQLDWEFFLPSMMFSYNTAMHEAIGTSPFMMMHGYRPNGPEKARTPKYFEMDDVAAWVNRFQHIYAKANGHAMKQQEKNLKNSNDDRVILQPNEGQQVWLDHHHFLGKTRKFAHHWKGPYIVTKIINDQNVEVRNHKGRKWVIHRDRLKYNKPMTEEDQSEADDSEVEGARDPTVQTSEAIQKGGASIQKTLNGDSGHSMVTRSKKSKAMIISPLRSVSPSKNKEKELLSGTVPRRRHRPEVKHKKEHFRRIEQIRKPPKETERKLWAETTESPPASSMSWRGLQENIRYDNKITSSSGATTAAPLTQAATSLESFWTRTKIKVEEEPTIRKDLLTQRARIFSQPYLVNPDMENGKLPTPEQQDELARMVAYCYHFHPDLDPALTTKIISICWLPMYHIDVQQGPGRREMVVLYPNELLEKEEDEEEEEEAQRKWPTANPISSTPRTGHGKCQFKTEDTMVSQIHQPPEDMSIDNRWTQPQEKRDEFQSEDSDENKESFFTPKWVRHLPGKHEIDTPLSTPFLQLRLSKLAKHKEKTSLKHEVGGECQKQMEKSSETKCEKQLEKSSEKEITPSTTADKEVTGLLPVQQSVNKEEKADSSKSAEALQKSTLQENMSRLSVTKTQTGSQQTVQLSLEHAQELATYIRGHVNWASMTAKQLQEAFDIKVPQLRTDITRPVTLSQEALKTTLDFLEQKNLRSKGTVAETPLPSNPLEYKK